MSGLDNIIKEIQASAKAEAETILQTEIDVVKSSGWDFVDSLRGTGESGGPGSGKERDSRSRCRPYEGVNG